MQIKWKEFNGFIVFSADSIKVRFYEENDKGDLIWDAWGTEVYVHYQFGIALKTPPYRRTNIKENVSCLFHSFM